MVAMDLIKNKYIQGMLAILIIFSLGYGAGKYTQPAKTVVQSVDKTVTNQTDDKNVVTTVIETKKPDGTDTVTTTTEDKSVITVDTKSTDKTTDTVTNAKPQFRVRLGTGYNFTQQSAEHSLGIEKRFWGPVSLGVQGSFNSSGQITSGQATLSWEF